MALAAGDHAAIVDTDTHDEHVAPGVDTSDLSPEASAKLDNSPTPHIWVPTAFDKRSGHPATVLCLVQILSGVASLSVLSAGFGIVGSYASSQCVIKAMFFYVIALPVYEVGVLAVSFAITGSGVICNVIHDHRACTVLEAYIKWCSVAMAVYAIPCLIAMAVHLQRTRANKRAYFRQNRHLVPATKEQRLDMLRREHRARVHGTGGVDAQQDGTSQRSAPVATDSTSALVPMASLNNDGVCQPGASTDA